MDDAARDIARDEFAAGMATEQRRQGRLPTPRENAELADPYLEQLERQIADEPPPPVQAAERPQRGAAEIAAERGYRLIRDESVLPAEETEPPQISERVRIYYERMWARVGLLLTKPDTGPRGEPSWCMRVKAAARTWQFDRVRGVQELIEVCDDSCRLWGDWRSAPAVRLYGGPGL